MDGEKAKRYIMLTMGEILRNLENIKEYSDEEHTTKRIEELQYFIENKKKTIRDINISS